MDFVWDEWSCKNYYMFPPELPAPGLTAISQLASLGLTIASGEWIIARFRNLVPDRLPKDVVDAAWASMFNREFSEYTQTSDDLWRGPARSAVAIAISIINDAIYCLDMDPDISVRAGWMYNLAVHVIPEPVHFKFWYLGCIDRLSHAHPASETPVFDGFGFPDLGLSVAREAFDLQYDYSPDQANSLLRAHILRMDRSNPLLQVPAVLQIDRIGLN